MTFIKDMITLYMLCNKIKSFFLQLSDPKLDKKESSYVTKLQNKQQVCIALLQFVIL